MRNKTHFRLYSFFIVFSIMFVCLNLQEFKIKILTQLSVLISFFGGMLFNNLRRNSIWQ